MIKYLSGKTRTVGPSIVYKKPIADVLDAPTNLGAIVLADDSGLHWSNGTNWLPLLEELISTPSAINPVDADAQKLLTLTDFYSKSGLSQLGISYDISLTPDFSDIIYTAFEARSVSYIELGDPGTAVNGVNNQGLSYGDVFYWRARYKSTTGEQSNFCVPLKQTFPKRIQDPKSLTDPDIITGSLTITDFKSVFDYSRSSVTFEIFKDPNGTIPACNPIVKSNANDTAVFTPYGTTIQTSDIVQQNGSALEDGTRYYWRAKYTGTNPSVVGDFSTVDTDYTKLIPFKIVPNTIVLVYNTAIGSRPNSTTINLFLGNVNASTSSTDTNVDINWGDGTELQRVTVGGIVQHTYAQHGIYTVKVSGHLRVFGLNAHTTISYGAEMRDQSKLIRCESIGFGMGLEDLSYAFDGATNLGVAPTAIPSGIQYTRYTFRSATQFNGNINNWDMSSVVWATSMFESATSFNNKVDRWNLSNLTYADNMFYNARAFNQEVNNWTVSNCLSLSGMFRNASSFNQPLDKWDVSSANSLSQLFYGAVKFNQDLSSWADKVQNNTNFSYMFDGATAFNNYGASMNGWKVTSGQDFSNMFANLPYFDRDLSNWTPNKGVTFTSMFNGAEKFNTPINDWFTNHSSTVLVMNMSSMFMKAYEFNQPLEKWAAVSLKFESVDSMFRSAIKFNQPLGDWFAAGQSNKLKYMGGMFWNDALTKGASIFNQDISTWNTENAEHMHLMFANAVEFNQDISNWNVANVQRMDSMFSGATIFDQPIGKWTTSRLNNVGSMFSSAVSFGTVPRSIGETLDNWDVSHITNFSNMFYNAKNFNQDLNSWNIGANIDPENVNPALRINMSGMFAFANNFNGNISSWETIKVSSMQSMFHHSSAISSFNQDISLWHTDNVTNMYFMFYGASAFNCGENPGVTNPLKSLNNWNVSKVTNMNAMFYVARAFNQDVSAWNTQNVTEMSYMFGHTTYFNKNLSNWNTSSAVYMGHMFYAAAAFNNAGVPLETNGSKWDVSKVTNMLNMFNSATKFNVSINNWETTSLTNISGMFNNATIFNQDISTKSIDSKIRWDTSKVTTMAQTFRLATAFNNGGVPLNWNVSKVLYTNEMFNGATVFNQPLSSPTWGTNIITNMGYMFQGAKAFNQPLTSTNFNTDKVLYMTSMFNGASSFNQSLGSWIVDKVESMGAMLSGTAISVVNYSSTLTGWANRPSLRIGNSLTLQAKYNSSASAARTKLTRSVSSTPPGYSWTISDGGLLQ